MLSDYPTVCAIVGDGPALATLEALAKELQMTNTIFAGWQTPAAVSAWMKQADVLVLPSRAEGRGMVLLEAMARETAVVTSDIPGPREFVDHGVNGLLFQVGSAKDLSEQLRRLTDVAFRNRIARRGRAFVDREQLTTAHSAECHRSLYERLISSLDRRP
jgi:glycosyltransferase involved in cell wall biosynthesis